MESIKYLSGAADVTRVPFGLAISSFCNHLRTACSRRRIAVDCAESKIEATPCLGFASSQFHQQKGVLLSVSVDTEHEFLAFGREAGDLFANAKSILAEVQEVLETATGREAEGALDLFDRMVGNAERLIAVIEGDIKSLVDELTAVRSQIHSLRDHRELIDRSVRLPLTLLRIGFCIEGANGAQDVSKALESVARDIAALSKELGRCTDEQFTGLEAATRSMELLMKTLSAMSEDAKNRHGEAGAQIGELRFHTEQMRRARCSQGEIAQELSIKSADLSQRFIRVVMALQYHDITRQQMEHIAQAFDTMREWIPSDSGLVTQEKSAMASLNQAAGVQIQQTRVALEHLHTAGREFREGMGGIAQGAEEVAAHVSVFQDLCHNDKVIQAVEGMVSLGSFIHSISAIKREVGEAACAIHAAVNDCTSAIEELSVDLRILAINARVQAAHAGKQGVIEVLANNIYEVSSVIQGTAKEFTSDIHAIMEQLSGLATRAWRLGTNQSPETRAVAEGVPQCVALLREIEGKVTRGLNSITAQQGELGRRISSLLPRVHFPEMASQRLETVLRFFEQIQEETLPFANGTAGSLDALASFKQHYTMASERNVHALEVDRGNPAVVPVPAMTEGIEPFNEPCRIEKTASAGALPEQEFGDDIELF